jgi:pseudaminic acid synthase
MPISSIFSEHLSPVKIVAELSANHNHDIELALKHIKAAKDCGADAVKIQTYTPDSLTINCDNEYFTIKKEGSPWNGETLYSLYQKAYTPYEWHEKLFNYANEIGIEIFSTPFDFEAVDLLENLGCPVYKIASFEANYVQLIDYVAKKNKPVVLSTGISDVNEITDAVNVVRNAGNDKLILLKCTSAYPAKLEDANILTMVDFKTRFNCEVGVSDHTPGSTVPVVATALGGVFIEKHFIIDRNLGGPDSFFSLDTKEFTQLVKDVRNAEKALGKVNYELPTDSKSNTVFKRSLFFVEDLRSGDIITKKHISVIRPGYGDVPKNLDWYLGKKVNVDIHKGTPAINTLVE